ncbi:hypothetical protein [Flavilitoribacter nigricans]|uniref:Uncharacterized protein n=1 Tax=Flavilitoribacter nigricans (strain ATCC 23147 / DSM 23189 / NBRC 102662 / NCIMB 1420 / SS-2) TaxID=1122177 RepID=A0A2D0N9X2_FLAN2|nr:hypothetical protein [Flavilitoribacter nigricans]PHN05324.1 hypothetical protein CRP01_17565 [Flavilitoribacter nigricans DSM 23189 = NBRC 102662]
MKYQHLIYLVTLFQSLALFSVQAQTLLDDAIFIGKFIDGDGFLNGDPDTLKEYAPRLAKYISSKDQDTINRAQLHDALKENPFLESILFDRTLALASSPNANIFQVEKSNPRVPFGTGIPITTIADGLAKFLVTSVQAELNIAFFRHFRKALDNQPILGQLFPTTTEELMLIGENIYRYQSFLENLRSKFFYDLERLDSNLSTVLSNHQIFKEQKVNAIIADLLFVSGEIRQGKSPRDLIKYLATDANLLDPGISEFTNLRASFKTLHIFSEAFADTSSKNGFWKDPQTIREVLFTPANTMTLRIFHGLIYQKFIQDNIIIKNKELVSLTRYYQPAEVKKIENIVRNITAEAQAASTAIRTIKKKNPDSLSFQDYYSFLNPCLNLLETGNDIFIELGIKPDDKITGFQKFTQGLRHLNEMILNVSTNQYNAAVADASRFLGLLELKNKKVAIKALQYGSFMASIVEAESSDQIAQIIDAVTLPPGSSAIKKYSSWNMAVNAYVGFAYGWEELQMLNSDQSDNRIFGLSAPIGLTLSKGLGKGGSLSLFGTAIDIGALTAFRFSDNQTKDLPELELVNILAPGGYIIYGFPADLPLSLGFGVQDGPYLRKISGTGTESWRGKRWGFFLAVDIPMFNIFSGTRKYK